MHKFIEKAHKHILLASLCTLVLAVGAWIVQGYMSETSTQASSESELSLSIIPYPNVVANGDQAGFLLYYKTQGGVTAENITLTATLPEGMTVHSASPAQYTQQGNQIIWNNLPDDYGSVVIETTVVGEDNTQLMIQGLVETTSFDAAPHNQATSSILLSNMDVSTYSSDMQVSLTAPDQTQAGETQTYTIQYQNNGPSNAQEVLIVMAVPDDITYLDSTLPTQSSNNPNTLVWRIFDVDANTNGSIQVDFYVSTLLDPEDVISTNITIASSNNEIDQSNNQAQHTTTIIGDPIIVEEPLESEDQSSQTETEHNAPDEESTADDISEPVAGGGGGGGGATESNDSVVAEQETVVSVEQESTQEEDVVLPKSSGFLFDTKTLDLAVPAGTVCAGAEELQAAYTFAYGYDITTMPSLAQARMCDGVIRSELAKMMSNYAINVLGKTPDTNRVCEFADLVGQPEDLQEAAVTACQLGLMGLNADGSAADAFNPTQTVTRAIFGTAFSRLLYGDVHNGVGSTWYDAHLTALATDEIITNTTPTLQELRGYIMIMMQRSQQ